MKCSKGNNNNFVYIAALKAVLTTESQELRTSKGKTELRFKMRVMMGKTAIVIKKYCNIKKCKTIKAIR